MLSAQLPDSEYITPVHLTDTNQAAKLVTLTNMFWFLNIMKLLFVSLLWSSVTELTFLWINDTS